MNSLAYVVISLCAGLIPLGLDFLVPTDHDPVGYISQYQELKESSGGRLSAEQMEYMEALSAKHFDEISMGVKDAELWRYAVLIVLWLLFSLLVFVKTNAPAAHWLLVCAVVAVTLGAAPHTVLMLALSFLSVSLVCQVVVLSNRRNGE